MARPTPVEMQPARKSTFSWPVSSRPTDLSRGRPVLTEHELLDPVGVVEVVEGEVAEHREDRVGVVFVVARRARPVLRAKLAQPGDQACAIVLETAQRGVEVER